MSGSQAIYQKDSAALYAYALSLHQLGEIKEAILLYQQLLTQMPYEVQILSLLGAANLQVGNIADDVNLLEKSLVLNPNQVSPLANLAYGLHELGRYEDSIKCCDQAIVLDPNYSIAYSNKGNSLLALKRFEEAIFFCDRAILLNPNLADAYNIRGSALFNFDRYEEALVSLNHAINLNPNFANAYNNKGAALYRLGRFEEAIICCDHSIALNPNLAAAYNNKGAALGELGQCVEAIENYDFAIDLNLDFADAYFSKSLAQLLLGYYEEGWELYEWRWKSSLFEKKRVFKEPAWIGNEPVADKTIFIYEEQGLGDVIQMCRYVSKLNELGAQVILEVPSSLVFLLSTLKGDVNVVEKGSVLPTFDVHCPVMSLPLAFKTVVDSIPAEVPYLFSDNRKQNLWKNRLGVKTKPRLGFVCSGSTLHKSDSKRSIPLRLLVPLLNLPFEFHLLQKEIREDDLKVLREFPHIKVHHESLIDFSDTAALINEMDLVISVDTSVAHLAGALGKPVWILLSYLPDFRWLLDRSDSPWYPTATLFRQSGIDDWEGVISDVCQKLEAEYGD